MPRKLVVGLIGLLILALLAGAAFAAGWWLHDPEWIPFGPVALNAVHQSWLYEIHESYPPSPALNNATSRQAEILRVHSLVWNLWYT
jgi:hypothetical protein